MKMNFCFGFRILYTIFISNVFYGINCGRILERELHSYSRNCHNGTCDYELSVATATKNGTAEGPSTSTPDLMKEVMRLKVLLVDLSTSLLKDTRATQSTINILENNVTALHVAMEKLIGIANLTAVDQQKMKTEIDNLKTDLSTLTAVLEGKTKNGEPLITRPKLTQTDFTSVVGTDCAALYLAGVNISGVYTIQPDYRNGSHRFQAYCDMETDGGGWTIIQRRVDGSDDFFRGWQSYKLGFGGLQHDFWLGLDNIHLLTKFGNTKMRINLKDWNNQKRFSEFSFVRVADENDGYRILAGKYTGNAGDPFHTPNYHDRMQSMRFSTYDVDIDMDRHGNCALTFTSGWWFNSCFLGNLNGVWYGSGTYQGQVSNGIVWDFWNQHPPGYSLKLQKSNSDQKVSSNVSLS